MDEFSLRWHIAAPGSATFSMSSSQETVDVHTTYVGDGLGSVLQAAIDLQGGSSSAIAFLPGEPGGTCLFFAGADSDVYLQVVQFEDMSSESRRWTGGRLRWHDRISVKSFACQVALMAEEALARSGGVEAYRAAWGGVAFPSKKLQLLRDSISR
ncbi:hypothetical protein GCM10009681_56380 [Luedemannella helvata]|uniref:Uncharacterized protein n=1 Tax=Luedemannella helvata TaxID=349315 RepID=A0ABN2L813_9ACTN